MSVSANFSKFSICMLMHKNLMSTVIDFNGISTCLRLLYAYSLGDCIHCTVYIFCVVV